VIGDLLRNVDFRRALSLAVDRDQMNETVWLGTATPSSNVPASENKYYPGDEWRSKWAKLDLKQADQLLDKLGLDKKDSEGFRLRKDGKRLTLTFMAYPEIVDQAQFAELVKQQWKRIGVDLKIDPVSSDLANQRTQANTAQLTVGIVATDDPYFLPGFVVPVGVGFGEIMGVTYGQWWRTGGQRGKEPPAEIKRALELWDKLGTAGSADERLKVGKDLLKLVADQVFAIGVIVGDLSLGIRIAKNNLGNVPGRFPNTSVLLTPLSAMAQTYYFK
jgi:peptide/nickel transport system substrate-binding protein